MSTLEDQLRESVTLVGRIQELEAENVKFRGALVVVRAGVRSWASNLDAYLSKTLGDPTPETKERA